MRPPSRLLHLMISVPLLAALPGCALIIPENPSTPRYNSVLGAPRAPQLNPAGARSMAPTSQAVMPPAQSTAAQQATAYSANPDFPPVDDATKARADAIMAAQNPAPTDTVAVADIPPPPGASARQMPVENGQPMVVAASDYPDLHAIPPTPTDNAAERLAKVRAELEAERANADGQRAKLATDAAAEPSLLNPAPAPAAAPVGPQSSAQPANNFIALPPPPPPVASANGTAWDRSAPPQIASASIPPVAPPMSANAAMEPIILRPPTQMASTAPVAVPFTSASTAPMPQPAMQPALSGGFNPMADAAPITLRAPTSYAGSTNYLPPSRYTQRRN